MTLSRNIAFNTIAQTAGKAVAVFAGIVLTSVLTRRLGVESYGSYIYIYTLVLFANSIADWGSTTISTREASRPKYDQNKVFGTALWLKMITAAIVTAVLVISGQRFASLSSFQPALTIAALMIPFLAFKLFLLVVFQTQLSLWKQSVVDTISSLIFLAMIFLLPPSMLSLVNVFGLLIVAALVASLIGAVMIGRRLFKMLTFDRRLLRFLLKESAIMGLLLTVFSIYNRVDVLVLEHFKGQAAVGIYGLSYKIYENLVVLAAFFTNSAFPILASRTHKKVMFRRTFQKILGSLLVVGTTICLVTLVLASPVVNLISGPDFIQAVAPLQLLAFALIFAYINHATGYSLVALNHQKTSLIIATLALGVNLGLNWLLIPHYSYLAAAFMTLITNLFVTVCSLFALSRLIGRVKFREMIGDLSPRLILAKLNK